MTTRGENGWQSEKTLAEGIQYMLDNKIGTDVSIEVGPPDGETVTFRAHKVILISRSEVFEGMFSSGMTECRGDAEAKIRIEDIDADVFKEVLDHMYCESRSISPESALSVMYAAKKYMLSKLVKECCKCLVEALDIKNVIQYLDYSLLLDEEPLQRACLQRISVNAKAILSGTEILTASRLAMETVLEARAIVRESIIYEATLKWAKHQLKLAKPEEDPTHLQIREKLGDLLFKIRFPLMTLTEFAEISSANDLLTAEEKESIYYFLATKKVGHQLKFPTMRRISEETFIDRTEVRKTAKWVVTKEVDAINFKTNQDIILNGIGVFVGHEQGYDVAVEILQDTKSMCKKKFSIPCYSFLTLFAIRFDDPIFINAGSIYSVKAMPTGDIRHYGSPCQAVCTKGTVKFTFSRHSESRWTTEIRGQIPRLYFCIP